MLLSLSLHFKGHFSGGPGLSSTRMSIVDFIGAKGDGEAGNNCSYKTCKVPVKMLPPTNQHPVSDRLDALPVAQPTVSKH